MDRSSIKGPYWPNLAPPSQLFSIGPFPRRPHSELTLVHTTIIRLISIQRFHAVSNSEELIEIIMYFWHAFNFIPNYYAVLKRQNVIIIT